MTDTALELVTCQWPSHISVESIAPLTQAQRAHLHEIAGRLGFVIGSASEPGKWRCELGGYWWWSKSE